MSSTQRGSYRITMEPHPMQSLIPSTTTAVRRAARLMMLPLLMLAMSLVSAPDLAAVDGFSSINSSADLTGNMGGTANEVTEGAYSFFGQIAKILSGPVMWILMVICIIYGGIQFMNGKIMQGGIAFTAFLVIAAMTWFFNKIAG